MTNPELEARLQAGDRDAYAVYGDWLSERGDPRGELIAIQLELERKPDDASLRERERALLRAHREMWLGELWTFDPITDFEARWRWGFIDAARIGPIERYETATVDVADTIGKLMQLPAIDMLRELVLGAKSRERYPPDWGDCIAKLAETGVPAALRRLELNAGGYWDISSTNLGSLDALYSQLGKLEELRIEMGSMRFGEVMALPALTKLEIYTGGLTSAELAAINAAHWPVLETLSICIGETGNYGCNVELSDLEPILAGAHLPCVKHLALANTSLADQVAAALPAAQILPRLATLDLSKGTLSDAGARAILDHWDAFAHLAALDLSHAYLSEPLVAALGAKGTVKLVDLQPPDDDERYCEISE